MFHSQHEQGLLHATARAVSGDAPGRQTWLRCFLLDMLRLSAMAGGWQPLHTALPHRASPAACLATLLSAGGPVYVSDRPGRHNFVLLRRLVLPDGSVLRCRLPGRPTADCLFADVSRDGTTALKVGGGGCLCPALSGSSQSGK